jgi:hypothetical protein
VGRLYAESPALLMTERNVRMQGGARLRAWLLRAPVVGGGGRASRCRRGGGAEVARRWRGGGARVARRWRGGGEEEGRLAAAPAPIVYPEE